jgi:hypothetical protein
MRRLALIVTLLLLAVAGSAVAHRGAGGVSLAKKKEGPYEFTTTAHLNVTSKPKDMFFRAVSDQNAPQDVTLRDQSFFDPKSGDFKVRWFRKDEDITRQVRHAGYEFHLEALAHKTFQAVVTPVVNNPQEMCLVGEFTFAGPEVRNGFVYVNSDTICAG